MAATTVLPLEAFGLSVARSLRALGHTVSQASLPVGDPLLQSEVNVLAAGRPAPGACRTLEQITYTRRVPFIPVILDARLLQVGPVVTVDSGSCWSCWEARLKQRLSWTPAQAALSAYYDSESATGPQGYLEPFAALAAAYASELIGSPAKLRTAGGAVWQLDVVTRETTLSHAAGIHGCPRCGLGRAEATRSFLEMRRELACLWQQGSSSDE